MAGAAGAAGAAGEGVPLANGVAPAKSPARVWETGPTTAGSPVTRPNSRLSSRLDVEKFCEPTKAVDPSTAMALAWMYRALDESG
ncbi:MAG TPA: hypothetical protein VFC03_18360 [Acidimicrobiales bacterium]|nr:hypothetical protein [Acidimicrobiales bacterium]